MLEIPTVLSKIREMKMKRLYVVLFALLTSLLPLQMSSATVGPDTTCSVPTYLEISNSGTDVVVSKGVQYFYMNGLTKDNSGLPVAINSSQTIYNSKLGCYVYKNQNYFTDYSLVTVGKTAAAKNVFSFKTKNSAVNISQIQLVICDPSKCNQTFVKRVDFKSTQKASIGYDEIPYKRVVSKTGKVSYQQYKLLTIQVYYFDANNISNKYPSEPYPDMYQYPLG